MKPGNAIRKLAESIITTILCILIALMLLSPKFRHGLDRLR